MRRLAKSLLGFVLPVGLMLPIAVYAGDVVLTSDMTTVYPASLGATVRGVLVLRNTGIEAETVSVVLHDYATRAPNTRDVTDAGTLQRSLSAWLTMDKTTLAIPAGQTRELQYQVTVPEGATIAGSYWVVAMVEEAPEAIPIGDSNIGLLQRSRIASRIVVTVPGGSEVIVFTATGLTREGGTTSLYTDIENTGTRMLELSPKVELYTADGKKQGTYLGSSASLYPGSSWRYAIDLSAVPTGDYTAILIADGGDGALFGARHPVRID